MAEYEKKVRQILSQNGCTFRRRGKGDHDIWYSPIRNLSKQMTKKKYYNTCTNNSAKKNS